MSLKQKNERAFRAVVAATLPAGTPIVLATSQENQTVTRGIQMFSFDDTGGPERPLKSRTYYRKVIAMVRTSFDKQAGDAVNPEDTHAANIITLKNALNVANLAAVLSAAQSDYQVLGVIDHGEAEVEPDVQGRAFTDGFSYEVVCLENDCS